MSGFQFISRSEPLYLPFSRPEYKISMGLVALQLKNWIEVDEHFYDELKEKKQLLISNYPEVFASRPGSLPAQTEVLDLVLQHMTKFCPGVLKVEQEEIILPKLKWKFRISNFEESPLDLCGRLVQEDLCLMAPGPDGYTLEAASLCFPARWRLMDKMGLPMSGIHKPVPDYSEKLSRPVDSFFNRIQVDRPFWRVNWSLTTDPTLFQPVRQKNSTSEISITSENAGDKVYMRCERQTLRRLPDTGWILFTIKTYLDKISKLHKYPKEAQNLSSLLRSAPDSLLSYKNISYFLEPLLVYLEKLAEQKV